MITVPPDSGKKRVTLNFGAAPIYIISLATSINEIEIKLQSFLHSPLKLEGYVRIILLKNIEAAVQLIIPPPVFSGVSEIY